MKLKYYLRGLGIGIVVTAIIMSFTGQPEKLSDAQIKMRALELGMVEENVLADLQKEDIPSYEEIVGEEPETLEETTDEEVSTEEAAEEATAAEDVNTEEVTAAEEGNAEEVTANEEGNAEEATANEETEAAIEENVESSMEAENLMSADANGEDSNSTSTEISNDEIVENYIVISIASGNGSETVSRKLYEAGLVNSAVEYNRFLVQNGYDRRLKVGNHEIPVSATEEEMAKILCGMQ